MKKVFSLALVLLMILSVVSLAGCGEKKENLKFGLGVHSYIEEIKNADGENNGGGEATTTAAAVLLDKNGKIVKCAIDTAANEITFTSEGKYVKAEDFKTKYELKEDYGMKAYGGAEKEWYEQVDAFISVVEGKTLAEVKALKKDDNKGTEEVVNAGCTIEISDFVLALEKAVNNAADSKATAEDTLNIGFASSQSGDSKDATEEAEGTNEVDTTMVAAAVNADGEVTASVVDAVITEIAFDTKGVSKTQYGTVITTKRMAGADYGMANYGTDLNGDGVVKEWFEQANAFSVEIEGKNADAISGLVKDDGYGTEALQTAGCTISVSDMVKAAVKAATVK